MFFTGFADEAGDGIETQIEAIDSDAFRLVFDTGNPMFSDQRRGHHPTASRAAGNSTGRSSPLSNTSA